MRVRLVTGCVWLFASCGLYGLLSTRILDKIQWVVISLSGILLEDQKPIVSAYMSHSGRWNLPTGSLTQFKWSMIMAANWLLRSLKYLKKWGAAILDSVRLALKLDNDKVKERFEVLQKKKAHYAEGYCVVNVPYIRVIYTSESW